MSTIILTSMILAFLPLLVFSSPPRPWTNREGNTTTLRPEADYKDFYYTECHKYHYFAIYFYFPCDNLKVSVLPKSGVPDLSIFVSRSNQDHDPYPTKEKMAWTADKDNAYSLTISHWDTEASPGWYYIGVYNDCSNVKETASYQIKAVKEDYSPFVANGALIVPGEEDILAFPKYATNQIIKSNEYKYYRFCLPKCGNVQVSIDNCIDPVKCPITYAFPELIVSRTEKYPVTNSYR